MENLFTKKEILKFVEDNMSLNEIQEKMGFENIGQGYGYKNIKAFELGMSNEELADKYICYIPEYCYNDVAEKLDINSCYTYKDFKELCNGTKYSATFLFEAVDWQHPSSLLDELMSMSV